MKLLIVFTILFSLNAKSEERMCIGPPGTTVKPSLMFLESDFEEIKALDALYYFGSILPGYIGSSKLGDELFVDRSRYVHHENMMTVFRGYLLKQAYYFAENLFSSKKSEGEDASSEKRAMEAEKAKFCRFMYDVPARVEL